jgi:O-antigen ligase
VILRIWLYYGVAGVVLFTALFLAAVGKLYQCTQTRRLRPEDQSLKGVLQAWALVYVYVWAAGYSMHPPEIFLTVLFFSEVDRLRGKCAAAAAYYPYPVPA